MRILDMELKPKTHLNPIITKDYSVYIPVVIVVYSDHCICMSICCFCDSTFVCIIKLSSLALPDNDAIVSINCIVFTYIKYVSTCK